MHLNILKKKSSTDVNKNNGGEKKIDSGFKVEQASALHVVKIIKHFEGIREMQTRTVAVHCSRSCCCLRAVIDLLLCSCLVMLARNDPCDVHVHIPIANPLIENFEVTIEYKFYMARRNNLKENLPTLCLFVDNCSALSSDEQLLIIKRLNFDILSEFKFSFSQFFPFCYNMRCDNDKVIQRVKVMVAGGDIFNRFSTKL